MDTLQEVSGSEADAFNTESSFKSRGRHRTGKLKVFLPCVLVMSGTEPTVTAAIIGQLYQPCMILDDDDGDGDDCGAVDGMNYGKY
jgi:hypothetical protein